MPGSSSQRNSPVKERQHNKCWKRIKLVQNLKTKLPKTRKQMHKNTENISKQSPAQRYSWRVIYMKRSWGHKGSVVAFQSHWNDAGNRKNAPRKTKNTLNSARTTLIHINYLQSSMMMPCPAITPSGKFCKKTALPLMDCEKKQLSEN